MSAETIKADEPLLDYDFEKARRLEESQVELDPKIRAAVEKVVNDFVEESKKFQRSKERWRAMAMKICFGVTAVCVVLSFVLGVAIAMLTPLKTVDTVIVKVNETSGVVQVEKPFDKPVVNQGEETDKFFISEYLRAREGYDWGLANRMYQTVKAYSEAKSSTFNEYDVFMKSPKSPLVLLGENSRVVVDILSITLDQKTNSATARFTKTVMGPDGKPSIMIPVTYWIATLRYEYPNPKMKPDERRLNPLGMKIPSYQLVQESRG